MFVVGPTFFSSPAGGGGGDLTPGTPTPAIFGAFATTAGQIDSTRALVIYQDATDFFVKAVVVTDAGGGAVSFGVPVVVSSSTGGLVASTMGPVLDLGAGKYICAYNRAGVGLHSRIVVVTGSVITVGTEDFITNAASLGEASATLGSIAAISPAIVAVNVGTPNGAYVIVGNVSGGTVTWGSGALTEMSSTASSLLLAGGGVVIYGAKHAVADRRLWSCFVSSAGVPVPAYLTATLADRIHTPSAGVIPTSRAQTGANAQVLLQKSDAGDYYCTRAQTSAGTSTYSNSDANPNPLNLGPYVVPPIDTANNMFVAPSTTKVLLTYRHGGNAWGAGLLGVSGNVNMAGDAVPLTPSGASAFAPAVAFLTEFKFVMVWSAGGFLVGQVCNVS